MHLMIFYPGGVSHGILPDDSSDKEIYDVLYSAATIDQGNGKERKERIDGKTAFNGKSKPRRI